MKHIGLARLGRDAELKQTSAGEAYANLALAVDYRSGQDRLTQWISATLWGKAATALAPYLRKGDMHCFTLSDLHLKEGKDGKSYLNARCDGVDLGPKQQGAAGADAPAPAPRAAAPADEGDVPF